MELVAHRVCAISMLVDIPNSSPTAIWSKFQVTSNFEVGPALIKVLDWVEVPSKENYPVVLWQSCSGSALCSEQTDALEDIPAKYKWV